jgi:hypothetical protein
MQVGADTDWRAALEASLRARPKVRLKASSQRASAAVLVPLVEPVLQAVAVALPVPVAEPEWHAEPLELAVHVLELGAVGRDARTHLTCASQVCVMHIHDMQHPHAPHKLYIYMYIYIYIYR